MLALAIALLVASACAGRLDIATQPDGSYAVLVDGAEWLKSSPTFVRCNSRLYSTADGSLRLLDSISETGIDSGGNFARTGYVWSAGACNFTTAVRLYDNTDHAVFEQVFNTDFPATQVSDSSKVLSSFPAFKITSYAHGRRGFVSFQGDMCGGEGTTTGEWKDNIQGLGTGIKGTGPVVLFNEDASTSLVLGAFSNFMVHSQDILDGSLALGVLGSVEEIPSGFVVETLLVLSRGVSTGVLAWGDVLLARYGKQRDAYKRDFALTHLGYSTDNGAYYYYQTEPGLNYEDTLIGVRQYADAAGIPYRYVLLDSWWYFKGTNSGVATWDAMPSIFPHGLEYLYNVTNWPQQLHNRYWASNTTYAKQNGGKWDFLIDQTGDIALPLDPAFWDMLLTTKRDTGMIMYEQDWLDVQFDRTPQLQSSATLARDWMMQMGSAAARAGVTMQECMSHVRHCLQSVELPAITNVRASGDYHPGNGQWNLGTSSILAYAVGVAPSKDNYWSTDRQDGTHYGPLTREPYSRLQSAVSSLSTGPVAPSDKIGASDATLINRACTSDGTLLQPDTPAMAIDAEFVHKAFGTGGVDGEVWMAETLLSGLYRAVQVIAINVASPYSLPLADLGYSADVTLAVYEANSTSSPFLVDSSSPLRIRACGRSDFQLYTAVPVVGGWALLGEPNKWATISNTRFSDLAIFAQSLSVTLTGVPGEHVSVSVLGPDHNVRTLSCPIPAGSKARVTVDEHVSECVPL